MTGIENFYILLLKKPTMPGQNFVILFFLIPPRSLWINQKKIIISTIHKISLNAHKVT